MKKLLFLAPALLVFGTAYAGSIQPSDPIVVYHANPIWDGYPADKTKDGWNVFLLSPNTLGANTGTLSFIMKWNAANQCWGMGRDCRSPRWALSQGLAYVGAVNTTYINVEVRR